MVRNKDWIVWFRFPSINAWWAAVTVAPEANKTAVFSSGTPNGLIGEIPVGGQQQPNSGVGARLLWKNAQKNARKNKTSDEINKTIPHRSPLDTNEVWWPWNVLSRTTSRHHWYIVSNIKNNPIIRQYGSEWWNQSTSPTVVINADIDAVNGHGLGSTKWNGWRNITSFKNKLSTWKEDVQIY